VAVVTGSKVFEPLAAKYSIPFGVAGFTGAQILTALCGIVMACERMQGEGGESAGTKAGGSGDQGTEAGGSLVMNFYPSVVTREGNTEAQKLVDRYFDESDAVWRGMGMVPASGRILREEFAQLDAGSRGLNEDHKINAGCCCDKVLMGRMKPTQCPLFGKVCSPLRPQGACMVSTEGNCYTYYVNHRE
jgi:hydrogenase expression/formation protein HypD